MPTSSTSSSDRPRDDVMSRVPATARLRTVIVALALTAGLVAGWEIYIRGTNMASDPFLSSTESAALRIQRPRRDKPLLVFLGSSRVRFGISPEDVGAVLGDDWDIRTIGVNSTSGPQMLHTSKHLFAQGDVVVVGVLPQAVYADEVSRESMDFNTSLAQYHSYTFIEAEFKGVIRDQLRYLQVEFSPLDEARDQARLLLGIKRAEAQNLDATPHDNGWSEYWGEPFVRKNSERDSLTDLNKKELLVRFQRVLRQFREDAAELESRGVTVCLIRMPSDSHLRQVEARQFPREELWDELAAVVPERAWHFEDDPQTRDMKTYDQSHLPGQTAREYSRVVAKKIKDALARSDL